MKPICVPRRLPVHERAHEAAGISMGDRPIYHRGRASSANDGFAAQPTTLLDLIETGTLRHKDEAHLLVFNHYESCDSKNLRPYDN